MVALGFLVITYAMNSKSRFFFIILWIEVYTCHRLSHGSSDEMFLMDEYLPTYSFMCNNSLNELWENFGESIVKDIAEARVITYDMIVIDKMK